MAGGVIPGARRGNGKGRRSAYRPMSDINVTPLVDVMLVLLIVFMVAAPLLTVGVPVDLPKAQAPAINENKEPLVVTVNAEGAIYIQETPVDNDALVPRLVAITHDNPAADIYVRGDRTISYGRVLEVMSMIASAGFTKVSLIAEPPGAKPGATRADRK
jgi:biopolymer transport protein TolR